MSPKPPDVEFTVYGPPIPPALARAMIMAIEAASRHGRVPSSGKITFKVLYDLSKPEIITGVQVE